MPHSLTPSEGLKTRARVFPNAVIRSKGDKATYYGPDFVNCKDTASLNFRLPLEKVNNCDLVDCLVDRYEPGLRRRLGRSEGYLGRSPY